MRLQDKVALITGGGGPGIGRTTSELFAREGARIAVVDQFQERAEATAEQIRNSGGQAIAIKADVSKSGEVNAMAARVMEEFGSIDILMNSAATSRGDDILTIDEEIWDLNLDITLKSAYLCCKAVLPSMLSKGSGAIVNISSVNGLTGLGEEAYGAAKAGMINLTQNLAIKYSPKGIRANCITPGTIHTPGWQNRIKKDPQILDKLKKWYPLGRLGKPEDIAKAALFLASDDAAWITGTTLIVDGGLMAGQYRMNMELSVKNQG